MRVNLSVAAIKMSTEFDWCGDDVNATGKSWSAAAVAGLF